jgi:serine/threonine-protein kinase RsbW
MQARLTVTADDAAMGQVEAFVAPFAATQGLSRDDLARVLIVLEELITNLLKYGYSADTQPRTVEIALSIEGDQLLVELVDDACPFDPMATPVPELDQPASARPIGGLGLHIVRALTEAMRYRRVNDRNLTQLILRLESRPKD